jgi:hypothetical protein
MSASAEPKSVCVEDFCGYTALGHFPISFWADYYPAERVTRFGGDWCDVPDLHGDQPTAEQCNEWAVKHGWKVYSKEDL